MTVLLLATVIRGGLLLRQNCISRDGVHFITFARQLAEEPVRWIQITTKPPGYSFLVLWAHSLIGPALGGDSPVAWQLTGEVIALCGGVLVCGLVFLLTRELFDDRCALLAGVLAAFWTQGALLSADVLSDMPHLALYLASLSCILAAGRRSAAGWIIAAGFLAAAAYWIRQEALGIVGAAGLCLLIERTLLFRRRVVLAATFTACFIIGAAPYSILKQSIMPNKNLGDALSLVGNSPATGAMASSRPAVTQTQHTEAAESRPAAKTVLGPAIHPTSQRATQRVKTARSPQRKLPPLPKGPHMGERLAFWKLPGRMAEDWARSGRYVLAMLTLAALLLKSVPRAESRGLRLVALAVLMQLLLVAARTVVYGELSSRYMAIPAALAIPWAAAAMYTLTSRIAGRIYNPTKPRRAAVWASALMIVLIPMMFYIVRPEPRNKDALRAAGLALAGQRGASDFVLSQPRLEQVLYYADLIWPDEAHWRRISERVNADDIAYAAHRYGAGWYVDADEMRDEEIDVAALVARLAQSDQARFSVQTFDAPESLRAYVVRIGPVDSAPATPPAASPVE